eukprot:1190299-Prorocentrum_minimum.AAC.2
MYLCTYLFCTPSRRAGTSSGHDLLSAKSRITTNLFPTPLTFNCGNYIEQLYWRCQDGDSWVGNGDEQGCNVSDASYERFEKLCSKLLEGQVQTNLSASASTLTRVWLHTSKVCRSSARTVTRSVSASPG